MNWLDLKGIYELRRTVRQQRWYELMHRWGRRRWPGKRLEHPVAFNAMLQVPGYMKQKFLRRELRRLNIQSAFEIVMIDDALSGDTVWILRKPNTELRDAAVDEPGND